MRKLEIIATSVQDAINAQEGGATSVEVIRAAEVGGLTPPPDLVGAIRDKVRIFVRVIVRPQAKSFDYTAEEIETMLQDIHSLRQIGVNGVVFGALDETGAINLDLTTRIARAVHPLELTFHRAIDESSDAETALPTLKGVAQRILTSGHAENVFDGRMQIKKWIEQYGKDFTFACGGGIRLPDLAEIVRVTGGSEIHIGTAARKNGVVDSATVRQIFEWINA